MAVELRTISSGEAPAAVGPYSQAVRAGDLVFVSGQIPIDPSTGALVEGGIEAQVERVLANVDAILRAAGSSRDRVVKATVFLTDLGNFARMNDVYARFFGAHRPARAAFQVSALPLGAAVEIEVVALA